MKTVARDRVVVFRLSQEEYHSLKKACDSCGARNLSDFTRSELLAALPNYAPGDTRAELGYLNQQIASVQKALNHLLQLLDQAVQPDHAENRTSVGATSEEQ